jgi:isoquinoline 1-oxidoreductase beta subunit
VKVVRVARRDFLRWTGVAAGGLVVGCRAADGPAPAGDPSVVFSPDLFVSIDGTGAVSIVASRSEMGQGIRTSLPAVLADELEADWSRVRVVQAKGDEAYGDQNTDGSRSARRLYESMRRTGAVVRRMLEQAAADTWGAPLAECRAQNHAVDHAPSGRRLTYGELATRAADLPVPDAASVPLKDPADFRYVGKGLPIVDLDAMVRGAAVFGIDTVLPGMLHASIERPPDVGGRVAAFDEAAALAVRGVRHVVQLPDAEQPPAFKPLGGIAVLADTTWAALQGRKALGVEWSPGPNAGYDSAAYRLDLEATAREGGETVLDRGDVDRALRDGHRVIEAGYYAPHLAQAPMEPPVALAHVVGDRCDVWASTQAPQSARREVAVALGLEPENVHVNVTLLGGGFGRKSKPDFVVEAALLAQAVERPVKVTWSREDDLRHGFLHSVSAQSLRAAVDADGRVTAWRHCTVFPPIGSTFNAEAIRGSAGELALGATDTPFEIPNLRLECGPAEAHLRIGWMRSVANVYHAFAVQSFVGELADATGTDPKDMLLQLIGSPRHVDPAVDGAQYGNYGDPLETYPIDTARLADVVELVADKSGWGRELPPGVGMGIAAHRSFLSYVAIVLVAAVEGDSVRVDEAHVAIDCGTVLNSDRVHAQLEGSVVFGLGLALRSEITAAAGAITQSNFDDYEILRITETPRTLETYIVGSAAPPGGVGEPGVPPVAPALANAIFAASGRRLRELPLLKAMRT